MPAPIAPPAAAWLPLNPTAGKLEHQIHAAIRDRILDGRLRPGERLPSSRALAQSLGVARSTVVGGFERLRAEGFVRGHPGSAMRVADLPAPPSGARVVACAEPKTGTALPHGPDEPERFLPFRPGLPDLDNFPHTAWARCLAARARALRIHDLGYGEENGLAELRHAILRHVARARAVLADPGQVVVMPSAAAILSLLARVERVGPDRPVWLEEPGYMIARETFRAAGAALVPVPCDEEGIAIGRTGGGGPPPRLVYVTPSTVR